MTRAEVLRVATERLAAAGVETPELDARVLLLAIEEIDSSALISAPEAALNQESAFRAAVERRFLREPVSKILGYRGFWNHRFIVTPDVLDPRPETETLIDAALQIAEPSARLRIVDLGTGSGCILLTLLAERPLSTGIGVDQSKKALAVAQRNAKALKLSDRADFIVSDWFSALDGTFDLVVCNPPYISTTESETLAPEVSQWDPKGALFAGMDGLQAYRKIVSGLAAVLKPDGTAFFEIGIGQASAVIDLLKEAGFSKVSSRRDLGGVERCIVAQR